jgi:hypothetical protein
MTEEKCQLDNLTTMSTNFYSRENWSVRLNCKNVYSNAGGETDQRGLQELPDDLENMLNPPSLHLRAVLLHVN